MASRKTPGINKWYSSIILIVAGLILNILFLIVTIPERIYTMLTDFKSFEVWLTNVTHTFTQRGNVYHSGFYNRFMWHDEGAKSGDTDESMSSVTGKNEELENVGKHGYVWYSISKWTFAPGNWQAILLNKIDPNHNNDAIEDDEGTNILLK